MNLKMLKAALVGLVLSVSGFANAGLIYNVDSGWEEFSWSGGVGVTSNQDGFTLELLSDGLLTVVDSFAFGDEFEILINSAFHSLTSNVNPYMNTSVDGDADLALASGYSQGTVFLSAGTYTIDFKLYQSATVSDGGSPFTGGVAYFKVDTVNVPEPTTLAIFALGIIGLASRRSLLAKKKL